VQLAIDCASDEPGIALAVDGVAALTLTWETQRNHSVELLPNIERLLGDAQREKTDITAIFVDVGPGGYAALRVGLSIAKALAHGLSVPIVGIGRLELDAYALVQGAADSRIVAIHRAGRGELAWAAYGAVGGRWSETSAPAILKTDAFETLITERDILTGDVDEALAHAAQRAGTIVMAPPQHRVVTLSRLGTQRLADHRTDDPATLVPLYLRAPAIGPQG
jgi:tRNA threonylcarbamoyladenosine biosynthesis protein TsaB